MKEPFSPPSCSMVVSHLCSCRTGPEILLPHIPLREPASLSTGAHIRTVILDLAEMYQETDPSKPFLQGLRHLVEVGLFAVQKRDSHRVAATLL